MYFGRAGSENTDDLPLAAVVLKLVRTQPSHWARLLDGNAIGPVKQFFARINVACNQPVRLSQLNSLFETSVSGNVTVSVTRVIVRDAVVAVKSGGRVVRGV